MQKRPNTYYLKNNSSKKGSRIQGNVINLDLARDLLLNNQANAGTSTIQSRENTHQDKRNLSLPQ
jgi:hypothetical protein